MSQTEAQKGHSANEAGKNTGASQSTQVAWGRVARKTALISGAFSLFVCIGLFVFYLQARASNFIESERLAELRNELEQNPADQALKEKIRNFDLQLRTNYFNRLQKLKSGGYLLLVSVAVFLLSLKAASAYGKIIPLPDPALETQLNEGRQNSRAQRALAAAGLVVAVSAVLAGVLYKPLVPTAKAPAADLEPARPAYPPRSEVQKQWPRFRGPGGLGVSAYGNVPTAWNGNTEENILWKSEIPLPGKNSPVVWEDRVFLSGATQTKREVYCYQANSGELLWTGTASDIPRSKDGPEEIMKDTGYAAPTAATDGRRVYAIFANGDLAAFDYNGKRVWAKNLGMPRNMYGHAASLLVFRNLLIVPFDQEKSEKPVRNRSRIAALESKTGETVWEIPRKHGASWSTPIVISHAGKQQLITCVNPYVTAYDVTSGEEIWRCDCLYGDVAPSPVYAAGYVFATNTTAALNAIDPGGTGDVTDTHLKWEGIDGLPDICSPAANENFVFQLTTDGYLTCYHSKEGKLLWDKELEHRFKASPSLVGNKLYLVSVKGITIIADIEDNYKQLTTCKLGEKVYGSPAFLNGRIYMRGAERLYCITAGEE